MEVVKCAVVGYYHIPSSSTNDQLQAYYDSQYVPLIQTQVYYVISEAPAETVHIYVFFFRTYFDSVGMQSIQLSQ